MIFFILSSSEMIQVTDVHVEFEALNETTIKDESYAADFFKVSSMKLRMYIFKGCGFDIMQLVISNKMRTVSHFSH